jgi:hypothetical protein
MVFSTLQNRRKGGEHSHGGHNVKIETDGNDGDNNNKRGLASAYKETREKVAEKGGESFHRK